MRNLVLCTAIAIALSLPVAGVHAQSKYPTKPIRLLTPFAAGGGSDLLARLIGPPLTEALGQPIVVDNPSKLNVASAGVGELDHLAGELFKLQTGATYTMIPYKGSGPAMTSGRKWSKRLISSSTNDSCTQLLAKTDGWLRSPFPLLPSSALGREATVGGWEVIGFLTTDRIN